MKQESPNDQLKRAIMLLEIKRDEEMKDLKEHFRKTYESFKPVNLIKNTLKEVIHSPDVRNGIGKTAIGVASGYLVKNLLFRSSYNPIKIVAGVVLQTIVTRLATDNLDKIKSTGQKLVHALLSRFKLTREVLESKNHE